MPLIGRSASLCSADHGWSDESEDVAEHLFVKDAWLGDIRIAAERAALGQDEPPAAELVTPVDQSADSTPSLWRRALPDLLGATLTVGITVIAMTFVLKLWRIHPHVPMALRGDIYLAMIGIKNTVRSGWFTSTSLMGAPHGQNLSDFEVFDASSISIMKLMSIFTQDPAVLINAMFLVSFPLITLSAYIACRCLSITRPLSVAVSVLYAFIPYHFFRGLAHLYLSQYWMLPLVCMLACRQLSPRPLVRYAQEARTQSARVLHAGNAAGLAIVVLTATTGIYYATFALLLIVTATALRSFGTRSGWDLLAGGLLCLAIIITLALQALPSLLYQRAHGPNPQAVVRVFGGVEILSLKFSNLLMPVVGHRIPAFATLKTRSLDTPINTENMETLGLIGAVGVISMLAFTIWTVVARRSQTRTWTLLRATSALTLVCIIVGMIGGISSVIGALGFTEIRAWNRISIVIAFLALLALATLVEELVASQRWTATVRRATLALVAAALITFGLFDQTTPQFTPAYAEHREDVGERRRLRPPHRADPRGRRAGVPAPDRGLP